jgi:hypothetical protein
VAQGSNRSSRLDTAHQRRANSDPRIQRCAELRVVRDSPVVPVDTAWYVTEAPDRERILIAAAVGVGIGKSKRPFCLCVVSTESRCPRRMVSEVDEMSPAQDPDSTAVWPAADQVYGVPHVVALGNVFVLLPHPAIVPSTRSPTNNRSAAK